MRRTALSAAVLPTTPTSGTAPSGRPPAGRRRRTGNSTAVVIRDRGEQADQQWTLRG
ncbi:hypothetical protein [Streptomyces smaragdinus]|uniref:hypothetical protein n=1 Tax=Streptomyces smaragdinus TaxID=2585196 RepID=UPI001297050E|nr:hypothetical protein [Streptomyces smaragdinus]